MKKTIFITLLAVLIFSLSACTGDEDNGDGGGFSGQITVVTREDGSGTRTAIVETVGITNADGNDNITQRAVVAPGTSVMMTNVAENPRAIGYASTGVALADNRIRVLNINGVTATTENILSGAYPIQRPFIIANNSNVAFSPLAQDFVNFIMSAQGQAVVSGRNYVAPAASSAADYAGGGLAGTIVVSGSTSVDSLMQYLREAYRALNPDVEIDIHPGGTGAGINAVRDGLADIAMSSRDLRASELEFLNPTTIAIDGVAVIVNPENPITNLSIETVRSIFLGELTQWAAAQ